MHGIGQSGHKGERTRLSHEEAERPRATARRRKSTAAPLGRTCSGPGGAGAAEALLLDDEADPDEGGGGEGEERALEVGGEEVAAGVRHREAHGAAARGRRI